jgi:hypothetical protein
MVHVFEDHIYAPFVFVAIYAFAKQKWKKKNEAGITEIK